MNASSRRGTQGSRPRADRAALTPRDEPLSCRLFVAGRAVDLSGQKEPGQRLQFQGRGQLLRREVIVLDGVTGLGHGRVLEAGNPGQELALYLGRQRGRQPVYVELARLSTLRLEKDLVRLRVRELQDLVLDRGAVSRAPPGDGPAIHGRPLQVLGHHRLHLRPGADQPAGQVIDVSGPLPVREAAGVGVAILPLQAIEMDCPPVHARRCPGLEAIHLEAEFEQLLRERDHRGVAGSSGRDSRLEPDPNRAPQKGPRSQNHRVGLEHAPVSAFHARRPPRSHDQPVYRPLVEIESRLFLEQPAHLARVEPAIALGPRRPHRRPLRPIQHAEVERGPVGRAPHEAPQGVHFPRDRALGHPSDRRITGHLAHPGQERGHQQGASPDPGARRSSLRPRVPTSDHDHVVFHGAQNRRAGRPGEPRGRNGTFQKDWCKPRNKTPHDHPEPSS